MLYLILGLISWMFVEYLIHRFWLHNDEPEHSLHHREPSSKEKLFISPTFSALVLLPYAALAFFILPGPGSFFATLGLSLGYVFYEYVHYTAHHGKTRNPIMRYLKKHHAKHHFVNEGTNFGVTSPILDYVFATKS